jgi:hypothetical protein
LSLATAVSFEQVNVHRLEHRWAIRGPCRQPWS